MLRKQIAVEISDIAAHVITDPDGAKEALLGLSDRLLGRTVLRCEVCGAEYKTARLDRRYCGSACKQRAYRERVGK